MAKKKAKTAKKTAKRVSSAAGKKSAKAKKKTATKKSAAKRSTRAKNAAVKKAVKKAANKTAKKSAKKSAKSAANKTVKKVAKKAANKQTSASKRRQPGGAGAKSSRPKRAAAKALAKTAPTKSPGPATSPPPRARRGHPSGLAPREIESFRQALLEKRAQLTGDVTALEDQAFHAGANSGDNSRMPLHMADLGSDNFEAEFTLGLIEGERAVLREIDEALERIDAGTFGLCLATGKPIGKARLQAKPWAKYCYEYTLAQEQGRRTGF